MNDRLNNIFDKDSLEAIKNAHKIAPPPESYRHSDGDYKEAPRAEPIAVPSSGSADVDNESCQRLFAENKDLRVKFAAQKELITKIIASQNEMIKELNTMAEKIAALEKRPAQVVQAAPAQQSSRPAPSAPAASASHSSGKAGPQKTSAGEGLNPSDFSVEKMFYYGK